MACGNDEMEPTEGKCTTDHFSRLDMGVRKTKRLSEFKVGDDVKAQPPKKCALDEVDAQMLFKKG
jgi:hypothetical protein